MGDRCWKEEKAQDPPGLPRRDLLDCLDTIEMRPSTSALQKLRRLDKMAMLRHHT
jgi:hypothetical protein